MHIQMYDGKLLLQESKLKIFTFLLQKIQTYTTNTSGSGGFFRKASKIKDVWKVNRIGEVIMFTNKCFNHPMAKVEGCRIAIVSLDFFFKSFFKFCKILSFTINDNIT